MYQSGIKNLMKKEMTRKDFLSVTALALISLFGVAGVLAELISHAESPYSSSEAESGVLSGNAKIVSNATASGGNAVEFETLVSSSALPTGPTGSFTIVVNDNFDGSAGSSGTPIGTVGDYTKLNTRYWNQGWFNGPASPGDVGILTGTTAEGNTEGSFHGPHALTFPGDGYLHMLGQSGGIGGDTYSGRTYECGGINTAGLIAFNPSSSSLGTSVQDAVNAGTVTVVNGPSIFEVRMRYPGPNQADSTNWWPRINLYNCGDFSGGGSWPGGTSWSEEIDIWEGYDDPSGLIGSGLRYNFHQGDGSNSAQHAAGISVDSSLYNVDLSLAFHTYTAYLSTNQISLWTDGNLVFTDTSAQIPSQFTYPQYFNFVMQAHDNYGNGIPPSTTAAGNTDQMVDYFRVWKATLA
jgi:hypothetical protein